MPRPNPVRSMHSESNLARRIAFEREQRKWSYQGAAKRMTDAGCPIQPSAIYRIEKAEPPRRISVDELLGFAAVFEVEVSELLIPVEFVHERALLAVVERLGEQRDALEAAVLGLHETLTAIRAVLAPGPRRKHFLANLMGYARKLGASEATFADTEATDDAVRAAWPYPEYVGKAIERLTKAVERWANETEEGA